MPAALGVLILLAVGWLGFGGAAARTPFIGETTPTTQPNLSSGLPSIPGMPVVFPIFAKNAGQVSSAKSATTVNQAIQIVLSPNLTSAANVGGQTIVTTKAFIFPVSPNGSPNPFGEFLPVYVKTLGFGGIPTTLTLNARSHFTSDGLPTYFYFEEKTTSTQVPVEDPVITGQLDISISDVAVDGVPVPVGSCHTATPASIVAHAKYWGDLANRPPPPQGDEIPFFSPFSGGQLLGTLSIPSFTGCQNGSENLDPLFDALVSGTQNTLRLTATGISGYSLCVDPTNTGPHCGPLTPLPLPTNTQVHH